MKEFLVALTCLILIMLIASAPYVTQPYFGPYIVSLVAFFLLLILEIIIIFKIKENKNG
jgi:hypothetical protein